jgi:hypothetical protein
VVIEPGMVETFNLILKQNYFTDLESLLRQVPWQDYVGLGVLSVFMKYPGRIRPSREDFSEELLEHAVALISHYFPHLAISKLIYRTAYEAYFEMKYINPEQLEVDYRPNEILPEDFYS